MKKVVVMGMALCVALAFSACKSSESAYKKAYEKAKQQELAEAAAATEAPAEAPAVEAAPVVETEAKVVYNAERNMYRVVAETFDTRDEAARARDAFKAKYPNREDFQGAWLLYRL